MEEFRLNDQWFGKPQTKYANITATIIHITPEKVIVLFDKNVKGSRGRLFSKSTFKRLFSKSQQLNLFE